MSEDTKQPVVNEADTLAKPESEAEGARTDGPDLDTLLAEFDSATKTETVATKPAPAAATDTQPDKALLDRLQAIEPVVQKFAQEQFKAQMAETIKDVRGDLDPEVFDDEIVEGWLNARAMKDQRLAQAWLQKESNPKQWGRIKSELGREFKKKFDKMPDRNVTEDRAAVVAAVRASSTKAPPEQPANLGGMSNAEYRNHIRQQYGYDPGV